MSDAEQALNPTPYSFSFSFKVVFLTLCLAADFPLKRNLNKPGVYGKILVLVI